MSEPVPIQHAHPQHHQLRSLHTEIHQLLYLHLFRLPFLYIWAADQQRNLCSLLPRHLRRKQCMHQLPLYLRYLRVTDQLHHL